MFRNSIIVRSRPHFPFFSCVVSYVDYDISMYHTYVCMLGMAIDVKGYDALYISYIS